MSVYKIHFRVADDAVAWKEDLERRREGEIVGKIYVSSSSVMPKKSVCRIDGSSREDQKSAVVKVMHPQSPSTEVRMRFSYEDICAAVDSAGRCFRVIVLADAIAAR